GPLPGPDAPADSRQIAGRRTRRCRRVAARRPPPAARRSLAAAFAEGRLRRRPPFNQSFD
ncbi:MAG TPA: hypothetical protein P5305_05355, partial [Rubrivivax sp.]|nr:hypothetical protein [Rubrivivax sp.]